MKNFLIQESAFSAAPTISKKNDKTVEFIAILQEADKPNRNGRVYYRKVLEEALNAPYIQERIRTNSLYGEAGHPMDTSVQRQMTIDQRNIAFLIKEFWWEGNLLKGRIETADTVIGRDMKGLIEQGSRVAFSLRAQGNVHYDPTIKATVVQSPIQIATYDWVVNPSHDKAFLESILEETRTCLMGQKCNGKDQLILSEAVVNLFEKGQLIQLNENEEVIVMDYAKNYHRKIKPLSEAYVYEEGDQLTEAGKIATVVNKNETKKVVLEDFLLKDLRHRIARLTEEEEVVEEPKEEVKEFEVEAVSQDGEEVQVEVEASDVEEASEKAQEELDVEAEDIKEIEEVEAEEEAAEESEEPSEEPKEEEAAEELKEELEMEESPEESELEMEEVESEEEVEEKLEEIEAEAEEEISEEPKEESVEAEEEVSEEAEELKEELEMEESPEELEAEAEKVAEELGEVEAKIEEIQSEASPEELENEVAAEEAEEAIEKFEGEEVSEPEFAEESEELQESEEPAEPSEPVEQQYEVEHEIAPSDAPEPKVEAEVEGEELVVQDHDHADEEGKEVRDALHEDEGPHQEDQMLDHEGELVDVEDKVLPEVKDGVVVVPEHDHADEEGQEVRDALQEEEHTPEATNADVVSEPEVEIEAEGGEPTDERVEAVEVSEEEVTGESQEAEEIKEVVTESLKPLKIRRG